MNEHPVEVVSVVLEPIPRADRVALVRIGDYTCVVGKDEWTSVGGWCKECIRPFVCDETTRAPGHETYACPTCGCCQRSDELIDVAPVSMIGAYIPPDSLVDTKRPEFTFLASQSRSDGMYRVKAKRIRGVASFGLLVPAPPDAKLGDDVAEQLGVIHYDPDIHRKPQKNGYYTSNGFEPGPPYTLYKYDIGAGRKYGSKTFTPGDMVFVTEKIHGANARYTYYNGRMYAGSRSGWVREYADYSHITHDSLLAAGAKEEAIPGIFTSLQRKANTPSMWWKAMPREVVQLCKEHPRYVVYGEVYGQVQDLTYDHKSGELSFAAFDIYDATTGWWLDIDTRWELLSAYKVPHVPFFGRYEYSPELMAELAEGKSKIANHVREGIVAESTTGSRRKLKWINPDYLERSK